MQYLVIEAAQDPTFAHEKEYGGATVGCWIKNQTEKNAVLIARGWIEEQGWVALDVVEQDAVTADDYDGGSEEKRYFDQALVDDEVFVFHTYPRKEPAQPDGPSNAG